MRDQHSRLIGRREWLAQVIGPTGLVIEPSEAVVGEALLSPANLIRARAAVTLMTATVEGDQLRLLAVPVTRPDGTWVNSEPRWYENMPDLVTAYSVLALEETLGK